MNSIMLIVDDVRMNREILKVIFNQKYEIMEAESGEEALAILEGCQGSIDIVLLDLIMNGLSGFEVLERRKNMPFFQKIPVVVVTGSGQMEDQVRAFDLGASEFIAKPFVPEIVLSRVNNVMQSNQRMLSIELEAQKMKIKSEVDEMTGVLNKSTTEYHMDKILKMSGNKLHAMMVIDIDNFKTVNDTSGHQAGDHVIKIVSNLISGLFRKSDIVGRIGGDEFCVLMVDIPNINIAREKANELIQVMRYKPNLTIPEYVTLSIGMASNEKKNMSYRDLFKKADHSLYDAKEGGKAQYREYGIKPITVDTDDRPIVILLSDNRNVCSVVHALIPTYVRILEVLKMDELDKISYQDKERTIIMYVDVSDHEEDMNDYWKKLSGLEWIEIEDIFAMVQEGNIPQYLSALKNGVADIITTPIEHDSFKRRTIRHLEKLGIKEVKADNA